MSDVGTAYAAIAGMLVGIVGILLTIVNGISKKGGE
jgi:hypothetical protein